ncbi:MAG TPA: tetratricopeptide repeat protein [Terriglobales bacterium]|nr:tetratricopeptide repeat protein [Terriglobales bacterium]
MASPATTRVSPSAQTDSLFSSPEKRNLVLALLLVVATLALYNPVVHHPFVNFDDDRYVTDNIHVRAGLHWDTIKWAFTSFDEANWHPLTWLSHALDCQLFGLNPAGHHYINVLLHVLNAVLLFWVLWRATGSTGRSWMVAALFALHPINVESVAWVAERKTVLSMLFLLLALAAYGSYAKKPSIGRYTAVVAALFACGLMAKPMVITFPFLLLLWDYWPLQRTQSFAKLALEKIPLLALSAASAVITVKAQRAGEAIGSMVQYPLSVRIENAAISYVRYLGKALWPSALSPQYPYPEGVLIWQAIGAAILLLAITVLVCAAGTQRRYLAVGWLWFLGTLVPMIGLVQVGSQAMADRYAYLPFVGLFIVVCWGLADLAGEKTASKIALVVASCIALAALSIVAFRQIGYWNDNLTLWSHAVAVTPGSFIAQNNLGGALLSEGKEEEAMPHFRAAAALNPADPMSRLNLAAYAQRQGHPQEAIDQYAEVLTMTRDPRLRATAFSDMGYALRDLGDSGHAKASFRAAVNLRPRTLRAWLGLGLSEQKSGNYAEAIKDYAQVLAIQRWDLGYFLMGRALEQNGQPEAARAAMEQARRLSENFDELQKTAESLMAK